MASWRKGRIEGENKEKELTEKSGQEGRGEWERSSGRVGMEQREWERGSGIEEVRVRECEIGTWRERKLKKERKKE